MYSREFLQRLMGTRCPTGHEQEASRVWREEARGIADAVRADTHGNSIAVLNEGGLPRVMLAGHIDELGLQIAHINKEGFLFFRGLGGWDMQVLVGQRVRILTSKGLVLGVIGRPPIHLQEEEDRKKVATYEGLWIDIGAKDQSDAERVVSVGDAAVLDYSGPEELLNGLLVARGFDDRIGAFVVIEAMRHLRELGGSRAAVYSVATSQEEIGVRGAQTSCFGIDPQIGIAVDVGFATDTPDLDKAKKRVNEIKLGKGPLIVTGPNINPKVFSLIIEVAKGNSIPYQVVSHEGLTGTDARAIQVTRSGVATGLISIPNRYMHSPCEIVHMDDVWGAIRLIAFVLKEVNESTDFTY